MNHEIQINGKTFRVPIQKVGNDFWIHLNGKTYFIQKEIEQWGKKSNRSNKEGAIVSPMPGKITKILKKEGQSVNAGEVVVVVEAMKMEYSLKSEIEGKVSKILCQVNDQVVLGKVLCEIEK